jgi:hypothetical protein
MSDELENISEKDDFDGNQPGNKLSGGLEIFDQKGDI